MSSIINPADVILMFDPGHGTREYTKGKCAPDHSLYEGEWARDMVPRLMSAFGALGIQCINIVPENEDIARMERVKRANKIVADNKNKKCFYLSIHLNAAGSDGKWKTAQGFCVYVARTASDMSKTLGRNLYEVAEEMGLAGNRSVPKEKYWQANFDVIYFTKCPAVLTENLFQDNLVDLEFIKSERGKEIIVDLHLAGVCKTLGIPYALKIG